MKAKYSKYFFKHIVIYFEPSVLILPFAFYFNSDAIQFSCLWFSIVYYYNKQYDWGIIIKRGIIYTEILEDFSDM